MLLYVSVHMVYFVFVFFYFFALNCKFNEVWKLVSGGQMF
jgi:hypothetical protein